MGRIFEDPPSEASLGCERSTGRHIKHFWLPFVGILPLGVMSITAPALAQGNETSAYASTMRETPSAPPMCEGRTEEKGSKLSLSRQPVPYEVALGAPQEAAAGQTKLPSPDASISPGQAMSVVGQAAASPDKCHPDVSYSGGVVIVEPNGAAIRDVLKALAAKVGIALDLPPTGLGAKVFDERIGPAPPLEALVDLLYGSGINYMIQSASDDPHHVQRVVVSGSSPRPHGPPAQAAIMAAANNPSEDSTDATAYGAVPEDSSEAEDPLPPPVAPSSTAKSTTDVPGVPENFNLQQAAAEAHKSPGEILDELQKRQLEILNAQAPPPQ